jgi:hypothetical protein
MVDRIVLEAKRIVFVHEPFQKTEATTPLGIITSVSAHSLKAAKKARILCFPRAEAFHARIYLSHFIHIDKPRHIEVECSSGWNEIKRAEVRLKSASAGLRLRTANATIAAGDVKIEDNKPTPGVIVIGTMAANSTATLKVPYDMETILQDLTIKIDVDYYTDDGQFQYTSTFTIPVELPLDVNVHDHFKSKSLFSKFNIKTANQVPLELLDVALEGSEEFEVHAPRRPKEPINVFPKQPVAVTYKVIKKGTDAAKKRQSRISATGSLSLSVEYRCLNEDVLDRARKLFADAVEDSPVHRLARLLTDTFATQLEHHILPPQYEKVALLEKLELGAFEDMGWVDCLESLPLIIRDDTQTWLQKWHQVSPFRQKHSSLSDTNMRPATQDHIPRQRLVTRQGTACNRPSLAKPTTPHDNNSINPSNAHPSHCFPFPHQPFHVYMFYHRDRRPTHHDHPTHLAHASLGITHQSPVSSQPHRSQRTNRLRLHHRRKHGNLANRRPTTCSFHCQRRRAARVAHRAHPAQTR